MSEGGSNNKKQQSIVIALAILLLLALVKIGIDYSTNKSLTADNMAKQEELTETYFSLDSVSSELDKRIQTITELGGEIDTLLKVKEQLEKEKEAIRTRSNREIGQLKARVEGYRELLVAQDEEITKLRAINEKLLTENTGLKEEKNELTASIRDLNQSKNKLEEKVALASQLKVENMVIAAVNSRGKETIGEFKNRQVESIKVTFNIAENKVAPVDGKDVLVRIVAPDGNVLFDVTRGSGTFLFDNREMYYTAKQEILFDNTRQKLSFLYDKGSEYAVGIHKVEVYTDGYLMGAGSFTVK
ncbi:MULTISPECIES: chromosome segregation protein SMC [unclassified Imperialibacter]|uniref:chromosome segregation protein SMC n=1 Tax=unclassified Imperialibacter TaxID=2629706 RepID=UPI0012569969|nr:MULTISPECIES: chromosome segregation protein SMC [unclassified Imperialibacter]CAD5282921.1 Chromosome segregation protein SMC [Imperialibacter sp. 89]CAD5286640.1 Chromosome segregation protein SMC [Imperialibacter sp. 75]VVT30118.1 Chromosome segregation protein SMC [Imperialibacter sp. EC-SDR9]